jgi:hypothetical protein
MSNWRQKAESWRQKAESLPGPVLLDAIAAAENLEQGVIDSDDELNVFVEVAVARGLLDPETGLEPTSEESAE